MRWFWRLRCRWQLRRLSPQTQVDYLLWITSELVKAEIVPPDELKRLANLPGCQALLLRIEQ